jgi:hypothetical protein
LTGRSKYRWITLLALAIVCQLVVSRVAEAAPTHFLGRSDITKPDHAAVTAAPHNPLTAVESKGAEKKLNTGFAKSVGGYSSQQLLSVVNAADFRLQFEHLEQPAIRLWLLYRSLLL